MVKFRKSILIAADPGLSDDPRFSFYEALGNRLKDSSERRVLFSYSMPHLSDRHCSAGIVLSDVGFINGGELQEKLSSNGLAKLPNIGFYKVGTYSQGQNEDVENIITNNEPIALRGYNDEAASVLERECLRVFDGFGSPAKEASYDLDDLRESSKICTPGDIAKIFSVTSRTASNWFDKGMFGGSRTPTGHRKISEEEIYDFICNNYQGSDREMFLERLKNLK